jgi:hypothetical protein
MQIQRYNLKNKMNIGRLAGRPGAIFFSAVLLTLITLLFGRQPAALQAQNDREGVYFAYLPLTFRTHCLRYLEQDQLLVMEVEHAPPVAQWSVETNLPGFTGDSYYTWRGPDYFGTPGNAILSYPIQITNAGEFNFRLHNRHDYPDPTEENDVWVKMDSGSWVKVFSPVAGQWTWGTFFDFGTHQTNASYLLSPGPHTIQISARSHGISIDRITLYKGLVQGEDTSLPVSECI